MSVTLKNLLADGKVHVLDGAMGTMLYAKGFFLNVCYDELNLKQPTLVQEVHEEYVRAGAEILETNTFGANPVKLGSYGLADDTEKINQAAAELARRASGGRASVIGAIGPLGVRIEPFGPTSREEAFAYFRRQAQGLLCAPDDRVGGAHRGRLLRHHAGAHQEDPRLRGERGAAPSAGGRVTRGDRAARGCRGGAVGRALALGREARRREARDQRRDRSPARSRPGAHARAVPRLEGRGRGRGERPRWPAGAEPDGGPALGDAHSARGGDRDRDSLLLPRSQPARHAVGHPGRAT